MFIDNRIKKRMREIGVKGVDITKATGVSSGGVSQWVNGITKPDGENLVALAKVLRCSTEWLATGKNKTSGEVSEPAAPYNPHQMKIPVLSWSDLTTAVKEVDFSIPFERANATVGCPIAHSDFCYALTVEGDDMTSPIGRSYPEGCLIYVDAKIRDAKIGERVIAKTKKTGRLMFKQLAVADGETYLKPLNTSHRPTWDDFDIVGKVIGAWIDD